MRYTSSLACRESGIVVPDLANLMLLLNFAEKGEGGGHVVLHAHEVGDSRVVAFGRFDELSHEEKCWGLQRGLRIV